MLQQAARTEAAAVCSAEAAGQNARLGWRLLACVSRRGWVGVGVSIRHEG